MVNVLGSPNLENSSKALNLLFLCYSISTKRGKKFLKFKHISIQTICYPPKRVVGSV